MSTKIYGGRRIALPIADAYRMLVSAKPDARRIAALLAARRIASLATAAIDRARHAGAAVTPTPAADAWLQIEEARMEIARNRNRHPADDFSLETWLFPRQDDVLAMVSSEQPELLAWFDALPGVSNHAYWDSTDPPEDVAEDVWSARRDDWEGAMPTGVPADRCLTFVIVDGRDPTPYDLAAIHAAIPPRDGRIRALANRIHIDRFVAARTKPGVSEVSEVLHAVQEALEDTDAMAAEAERVAPSVTDISVADLDARV